MRECPKSMKEILFQRFKEHAEEYGLDAYRLISFDQDYKRLDFITTVTETFMLTGIGLTVVGQFNNPKVPHKGTSYLFLHGKPIKTPFGIMGCCGSNPDNLISVTLPELKKEDVPIGTEVWYYVEERENVDRTRN